jgi:hypothetical protein
MAGKVDGETSQVARRAVNVVVPTVRLARFPAYVLIGLTGLFTLGTAAIGFSHSGSVWFVVGLAGLVGAVAVALFAWRCFNFLQAVAEPEQLATEFGIAVSLSSRVDETRGALIQMASGGTEHSWWERAKGALRTASLPASVIEGIGDLPRAKYFFAPKVGTTVLLTVMMLWLVPISFAVFIVTGIAALAR